MANEGHVLKASFISESGRWTGRESKGEGSGGGEGEREKLALPLKKVNQLVLICRSSTVMTRAEEKLFFGDMELSGG